MTRDSDRTWTSLTFFVWNDRVQIAQAFLSICQIVWIILDEIEQTWGFKFMQIAQFLEVRSKSFVELQKWRIQRLCACLNDNIASLNHCFFFVIHNTHIYIYTYIQMYVRFSRLSLSLSIYIYIHMYKHIYIYMYT